MKKIVASITFVSLAFCSVPVGAKKTPELTPMELQALQSHEYETTKEILFASVVSVFQDLGYQLENADMPSGFITASSATKNKTSFLDVLAKQSSSGNTRVTAFVEAMPSGKARVRLNFMNSKSSSSMWGHQQKEDKPVLDTVTYRNAWNKIDEAIFTRAATSMTTQGKAMTPATVVPVTAGTSINTQSSSTAAPR